MSACALEVLVASPLKDLSVGLSTKEGPADALSLVSVAACGLERQRCACQPQPYAAAADLCWCIRAQSLDDFEVA